MAASRKKTETRKTAAGSGGKRDSGKQTKQPIRREVGGGACLLLALFTAIGYLDEVGWFLDGLYSILKGLLGYGFWFMPPAFLAAGLILLRHGGRPVRLRVTSVFLAVLMLGALLHLFLFRGDGAAAGASVKELWSSGVDLESGGVLSGLLSGFLSGATHAVVAAVLFILAVLALVMIAARLTPGEIAAYLRAHPRREYREEVESQPSGKRKGRDVPRDWELIPGGEDTRGEVPSRNALSRGKADIHIPLGDEETEPKQRKAGFFNRISQVKRPDQILLEREEVSREEETPESAPRWVPETVPQEAVEEPRWETPFAPDPPAPPPPAPVIEREPAVRKVSREETAQAAAEVAQDIAANMEEDGKSYQYPPISLLTAGDGTVGADAMGELQANQSRLDDTLRSFGIDARITGVVRGPSVTRYELELDQGVRLNKLTNLADDIALALGAAGVRIAPIPDKISMVGIEVPNKLVTPVPIHEVISSSAFQEHDSRVAFAVGKDIGGNCIVGNIAKLPHLLIAGTTGSGKSVCTNSLIISMLYKSSPQEVRLIMVDPKMVELGIYNGIPHLLIPVVTDPKKAAGALQWAVVEMMKRYRAFSEVGVRDLAAYNAQADKREDLERMPQIVVVIDELADLMLVAAKEVEESICRVAQMGRAAGMHLVIATQRPSADVITGLMKANIPSRIAFAVASALESRIILDTTGAEKLVGRGDMLYFPLGAGKPTRVQGCLISDEEVASVVEFVKRSGEVSYDEEILHDIEKRAAEKDKSDKGVGGSTPEGAGGEFDELLPAAIEVVLESGQASVSMLQRRLKLGYGRAARLVDQMEEKGVVGPFEGSKPRQLLITKEQWQEMQFRQDMVDRVPEGVPDELDFEGDAIPQDRDLPPFDMDG